MELPYYFNFSKILKINGIETFKYTSNWFDELSQFGTSLKMNLQTWHLFRM